MSKLRVFLAFATFYVGEARAEFVSGFEDQSLPANSFNNDAGASGRFFSGGNSFNNTFSADFGGIWSGWSISSKTTNAVPTGFANQYAAAPGRGANGSATYAVAFPFGDSSDVQHPDFSFVDLVPGANPISVQVTNTAYAYSIMKFGDPNNFARAFAAGDTFTLDIRGFAGSGGAGTLLGTVETHLADFRGGNQFIADTWLTVDLTALAGARSLRFGLRSTDVHPTFGINTPAYFALDDLTLSAVPEPSSYASLAIGLVAFALRRRSMR